MLFLFVWFLLFKFPPGRRGKQSLTVKQIGKHFFSISFSKPELSVRTKLVYRDNARPSYSTQQGSAFRSAVSLFLELQIKMGH